MPQQQIEPEPTRLCSSCHQQRPLSTFSVLASGSHRKTCYRHEKRAIPTDLWEDVVGMLRQHGRAQGDGDLIRLDVCIDYQNIPISIPTPASHDALVNASRLLARALWEASGYRFIIHTTHEGKAGSHFYFYCAQDQDRARASQSTGKRASSPSAAVHDCQSRLVFVFKPGSRLVNIRVEHSSHAAYCDRALKPEVVEYIETHLNSTPRQLYQDIMAHSELGPLAHNVTQKQVWYWWRERSSSSWRLAEDPFESIAAALGNSTLEEGSGPAAAARAIKDYIDQRPRSMSNTHMLSPDILGQAIRKEGSVRGYALYALGLITALRDRTVEISLDATFGTNNSGHDLFAVLAEVNGTGVPLLYLLLDTKDMRGDGRRIEMLSEVLAMLKGMGVSPSFVGCDKEAAEIKAIGQVWPDAKVQLCYWHVRRALRQRLGNGKATMTNQYDAYEAAATVPGLDVCWGVAERRRHRTELCTCPSRRTPTADDPNALNLTWDKAARLELPKEQNEALVDFVCRHYNAHPLFPSISGASMTAEQLRVQAATEAYQFCKAKGWARVWAYLWTNWYRSDEWKLWARSASPTIPVLMTTMICESHWRVVKHDYLHNFARPRIDHVAHIIRTRLIPHMVRRLQALLQGQTRMVTPSWKRELVTAWREAEQRDTVSDEAITCYKTCIHTWTCACESFLQSRFLICKHLVQTVNHMSTADIKAMERHREPPFWTHPALSSARPEQPCGQGCGIGVVRDAAGDPSAGEGEEHPNDGADDEGDVDENGDVNRDGVEEDAELEPSVTEKFEEAALMLTRMAKLLEREQPWSSRPFIDAFLRHNRQNFKLLEDDEKRLSRQSMALTWGNSRHQASMYLRGDDAV